MLLRVCLGAVVKSARANCRFLHSMRLIRFTDDKNGPRIGVETEPEGDVVDICNHDPGIAREMIPFLEAGPSALEAANRAVKGGAPVLPRSSTRILAPVVGPDKVICVGMNYRDHCLEQDVKVPKELIIFSKFSSCIVGPYDDIIYPDETNELDWEVELAFVIGKKGKHIQEENAMEHVAGFAVSHDVSARDWQMKRNGRQWLLGKTFDSFCPLGPALVTKMGLSDPHKLGIFCRVNGQVMQESNTEQMVFKTEFLVSWVSRIVTLYPGDIFLTGTPPGVGVFRKPPVFLKRGDTVECEIDEIGKIMNKVV
uniref:oxaloacetate tautomerase FAHD2A, mitochondrial-like n=1 Tax=Myxine glutinosa TaxID=7769 RepID=UPI00358FE3A7